MLTLAATPIKFEKDSTNVTGIFCKMNHFLNVEMEFSQLIPPSSAYMRHRFGSALVRIMACRLFDAKPVSEPTLIYCQLYPWEQNSVKFESKYKTFHSRKCIWTCRLRNGGHFVPASMRWSPPHEWNHTTASMARWVGMPLKSKRYFRLRSDFGSCLDNYGMLEWLLKTTDAVMLNEIIHITLSIWWDTFIKLIQYQFEASDT